MSGPPRGTSSSIAVAPTSMGRAVKKRSVTVKPDTFNLATDGLPLTSP